MKYLKPYNSINELSKNNPIQELSAKNKLGVILLGLPGAGKSTFARQVIEPHLKNSKTFSTDSISLMFSKDPNKFHPGSDDLNIRKLLYYIKTGQNFIYDSTGANEEAIYRVNKEAVDNGYKIIFILILIDKGTSKLQNKMRHSMGGHKADDDYIDYVYNTQNQTTKNYLKYLKPNNFYIVLNKNGKYKYYIHKTNSIVRNKSLSISESNEEELLDTLRNLHNNMRGFIRVGTPDEIYEDYFLELRESENFRVSINKGHGFVTNIDINGMIDKDIVESEFNRILNKMKMIKSRLEKQFGFDCHFMIWINGQAQQELNSETHRNDDYKFKGIGNKMIGWDKDYFYTKDEIRPHDRNYRPYPEDKAAINIKFMIV